MAKAILVDGDIQVAMQAFMAGQLKIEGDMAKAMSLQTHIQNPAMLPLHQKLLAITD
jgi:putative sterol carrier protein